MGYKILSYDKNKIWLYHFNYFIPPLFKVQEGFFKILNFNIEKMMMCPQPPGVITSPRGLPPSPRFSGCWGWGLPQPPSPRGRGAAPGGWGLSQPPGAETVPSFWGQPPKISAPTKNRLCRGGVFRNPDYRNTYDCIKEKF